ncbi:hypothetical protein E4U57_003990 [Claviceps arundinis]|uniref:Myocyte-specific enhancer factor 2d n=1 Tax=Claviceps arundinis TaxID=1623583 RepID=A0A9P7N058_9HYPO|nr:hypothetical protein E4U57_003990 [Claviceps arundinis]KAG5976434.1 hypothetical protein E4U56_001956 [Claviceps arundinis]
MLEIPGYYYDTTRKKYFKIESSHTAPSQAPWSADSVKKRRGDDLSRDAARKKAQTLKRHVKRHALGRDLVCGNLLRRETEGDPAVPDRDLRCAAWAGGVVDKGRVDFGRGAREREATERIPNLDCLWVGCGVAYISSGGFQAAGQHLWTDENDCITFGNDPFTGRLSQESRVWLEYALLRFSSISYHEPSHMMMVTSKEMKVDNGLHMFPPPKEGEDRFERRRRHETDQSKQGDEWQTFMRRNPAWGEWCVHSCTPAPASSNLLSILGTSVGPLNVDRNGGITSRMSEEFSQALGSRSPEIFTQDFQQGNHNVLFSGGRQPRLWITDVRAPVTEVMYAPHTSSINHVRSLNPHQILVAGLKNSMSLYDTRFFGKKYNAGSSGRKRGGNGRAPLLTFPGYKNAAHVHTGWDVCAELGLVAAAHDDGTVKLFSLKTGRLLKSPAVDSVRTDTPIKALMFSTMSGERLPSLWVSEGHDVRKFSMGALRFEDEA